MAAPSTVNSPEFCHHQIPRCHLRPPPSKLVFRHHLPHHDNHHLQSSSPRLQQCSEFRNSSNEHIQPPPVMPFVFSRARSSSYLHRSCSSAATTADQQPLAHYHEHRNSVRKRLAPQHRHVRTISWQHRRRPHTT
ncbi:hypothetical protein DEO72_LG5g1332 [Vigna unguiculata]|uniref:Uncharacterized protein n=1 Tax=Vigna unguiculata TaxID=3917 RepID=A0A4D6LXP0_VIGUN|nr:hypothetical protein DEO72_LG5g1332 [Vigna unguiculata]